MDVLKLYELNKGNQDQIVGFLIKGVLASVNIYGSQSKPSVLSDMVDIADGEALTVGASTFDLLPQWIYFTGSADSIEIIGMGAIDTGITFS